MKRLFLLLVFVYTSQLSIAQDKTEIEIGIVALPQAAWIFNKSDKDEIPTLNRPITYGYGGGIDIGINFKQMFGMQTGVFYSSQGQEYTRNSTTGWNSRRVELNYVKVPLLFRVNTGPYSTTNFFLSVGPQVSLLVKAKEFQDGEEHDYTDFSMDPMTTEDLYKPFDIGMVLNIGTKARVNDRFFVTLGFRMDYSLLDIENKSYEYRALNESKQSFYSVERSSGRNMTGAFNIGFHYTINKKRW